MTTSMSSKGIAFLISLARFRRVADEPRKRKFRQAESRDEQDKRIRKYKANKPDAQRTVFYAALCSHQSKSLHPDGHRPESGIRCLRVDGFTGDHVFALTVFAERRAVAKRTNAIRISEGHNTVSGDHADDGI